MPKAKLTFSAKVWVYPGIGGWHFVYVPKSDAATIRSYNPKRVGFGFVPVTATVGKTTWKTSLFPSKQEGTYLLAIKHAVRKKEQIFDHDTIDVSIDFKA